MAEDKPVGRARTQDDVGVTFVNGVMGSGHLNGIINITLGTFNFTPSRDSSRIEPDPVISCRLRLDVIAAKDLRDHLDKALSQIEMQDAAHAEQSNPASIN